MNRLIFTCGDPNGIGPEIVIKCLNRITKKGTGDKYIFVIPSKVFERAAALIHPDFNYSIQKNLTSNFENNILILDIPGDENNPGEVTANAGKISFEALSRSYELINRKIGDAVITAPINKTAINRAGISFPGQTEMFAKWTNTSEYAMTFLSKNFNAALFTIHEPIKKITGLISSKKLINFIKLINRVVQVDLGESNPKIALLGLNPHAGEDGIIGSEEVKFLKPVVSSLKNDIDIEGPFVPDAFFGNKIYKKFNITIGMYHDQILIPFKLLNFNRGVNYTAGLPVIRTSPDHGTGFDIAYKGIADDNSIYQAVLYAKKILKNRKNKIASRS